MDAAINMINEFMPEERLIVYTEGDVVPPFRAYTQTEPELAKTHRS